jgi:HEAT repeat protein
VAPDAARLHAAVERRLREPQADLDELARPLREAGGPYERLLLQEIQRAAGPRRAAAIDLLGRLGTGRSVPVLARLAANPETQDPAVRALARLADSDTLAALAGSVPEDGLQQHLLAALVARGDARSVGLYLEFVRRPERTASALAALDRVADPPAGLLFELLNSPHQARRSSAALALGRIDGPEVSQRLRQMVIHDVQRREALLALAASPDPGASRFLALAQTDPSLAALTHAAQHTLKRYLPFDLEVNQP